MSLGTSLGTVREMLKAEIGASLSVGDADNPRFNQLIESKQKWFASQYDWAELADKWDKVVAADAQYTDIPTTDVNGTVVSLSFDRRPVVEVQYAIYWQPVLYGIGSQEYNAVRPNMRLIPIMKWAYKQGDRSKFETWPIGTIDQTVRFTGQRVLNTLKTGGVFTDTLLLELDDLLIVLTLAAEELLRKGHPDAQAKAALAKERFVMLRGTDESRITEIKFGGKVQPQKKVVPMIIVSG